MSSWLTLETPFTSDSVNITGTQIGKGLASPVRVEVTEQQLRDYDNARDGLHADGRKEAPQWDGSGISVPNDRRMLLRVRTDRALNAQVNLPVLTADGVDVILITVEKMLNAGTVDTSFDESRIVQLGNGGAWQFVFVKGVATKPFSTLVNGTHWLLRSDDEYKIDRPLVIMAVG